MRSELSLKTIDELSAAASTVVTGDQSNSIHEMARRLRGVLPMIAAGLNGLPAGSFGREELERAIALLEGRP